MMSEIREKSEKLVLGLGLLALLALAAGDLVAQEGGKEELPKQPSMAAADPVVSLDFGGGSLEKFAAALRKAGEDVNIVMPALAAEVELPALTLSHTTVESALRSIGAVAGDDFRVSVKTMRSLYGKPVYMVSIRQKPRTGQSLGQQAEADRRSLRVDVLSLKYLTSTLPGESTASFQTMKAETILTAVDTGLGIAPGISQPVFRYHEQSGLLFVKGSPAQLGLVRDVIKNLEIDMRRVREARRQKSARSGDGKGDPRSPAKDE